jgi:primary-amine oxidase
MRHRALLVMAIVCFLLGTTTPAHGRGDRHRTKSIGGATVRADARSGEPHPLDPLTREEIATAAGILRADPRVPAGSFFPTLVLNEPPKEEVLALVASAGARRGPPLRREAYVEIYDRPGNVLHEAVVDLVGRRVRSFTSLPPGTQPAMFAAENEVTRLLVRNDGEWIEAMRRRGIEPDDVALDIWAGGEPLIPEDRDGNPVPDTTRIARVLSFFAGPLPHPYCRPIEGVVVAVDLNRARVLQVVDTGIRPLSLDCGEPGPPPDREPLKPLRVRQDQGPSFQLNGHEVGWQNWRFRFALHPRDGLVLYTVGYLQGGRVRSIAYRIGPSEVWVPYGLPDVNWVWRTAFDQGEYGLGRLANPLAAGVDVPENATFVDARLADDVGDSFVIPRAIALYERHGGLLWKRVDPRNGEQDARLSRELVLTANATIGNYVYGLRYVFRQDGSLEVRVEASGETLNRGVHTVEEGNAFGTTMTTFVAAPNHQHFVNFRLDLDVDERSNGVVELNTRRVPSEFGNAFATTGTVLTTEVEARRALDPATARAWRVTSAGVTNAVGHPTGYTLRPAESAVPYAAPDFVPRRRAAFVEHPLWITTYDPRELYAAGRFPYQNRVGEGLPQYSNGEPIVNTDIVLWYTVGLTHHPEVEEYPVMATTSIGFRLTPDGFFPRNPALDVPPPGE